MSSLPSRGFYAGKRVLVTGHSGFKGSWLVVWLKRLGAEVAGISLKPDSSPNLFEGAEIAGGIASHFCDIRRHDEVSGLIREFRPDIVFHLAAQALVRPSYADPLATFSTNVIGTAHVLDALRGLDKGTLAVVVTSDKVYENKEWHYPYREDDQLGGYDPYSASKACAEIVAAAYRRSFLNQAGIRLATARAGNVIGGGDWSVDRLLPDAVRAWSKGKPLEVRRPEALRPWQHVIDAVAGYLVLAERMAADESLGEAWNFGPLANAAANVRAVVERARSAFGRGEVEWATELTGPHEAGLLMLESVKARRLLGVATRWDLDQAVDRTMDWYRLALAGKPQRALCLADLDRYEACS
jgi:CDP-glucose 4,6-dehydratase